MPFPTASHSSQLSAWLLYHQFSGARVHYLHIDPLELVLNNHAGDWCRSGRRLGRRCCRTLPSDLVLKFQQADSGVLHGLGVARDGAA